MGCGMRGGLLDDVSAVQSNGHAEGEAPTMSSVFNEWSGGDPADALGGDPSRPLFQGKRTLRCKLFGCEPVVGEDIDACRRCRRALLRYDDCEAIVLDKPTLRCRLLGCKPGGDEFVHQILTECSCGRRVHPATFDTPYGVVHEGCCVRCGRAVLPTARVAR